MKRIKKAFLMVVMNMASCWNRIQLFYWANKHLYELRAVCIMPNWYYRWLFHSCVWLSDFKNFRKLADRAIHTIPYHIRFDVA